MVGILILKDIFELISRHGHRALSVIALAFLFSACLGENAQKEADCGPGHVFNSVSRKCISIQGAPKPLLSSLIFKQDQPKEEFVLNYSDLDGKSAFACEVQMESPTSQFSIRAKEYYIGVEEAEEAYALALDAYNHIMDLGVQADAAVALSDAEDSMLDTRAARNTSQMALAMRATANYVYEVGEIAQDDIVSPARLRGEIAMAAADELDELADLVANRCSCSGTVCRSVYVGKKGFFGSGGFNYVLEDNVGKSNPKSVDVLVTHVNTPPMPTFVEASGFESSTKHPESFSFTVAPAADVDDPFTTFFDYEIVSEDNTRGTVSHCMGRNGTSKMDRNCIFTPHDGDDYWGHGDRASVTDFYRLDLEATAAGEWGNDIEIHVHQNPVTRTGNVNGSGGKDNVVIEVDGYRIDAWVDLTDETVSGNSYTPTTIGNLVDAINEDIYASKLVTASVNSSFVAGDIVVGTNVNTSLAGGTTGGYELHYRVYDGTDYSINGVVSIEVEFTDNPPTPELSSISMTENQPKEVTLLFEDTDTNVTTGCDLITSDDLYKLEPCSCSSNVCTATIVSRPNFSGDTHFHYNVYTPHRDEDGNPQVPANLSFVDGPEEVQVNVSSVNKAPFAYHLEVADNATGVDPLESSNAFPSTYTLAPLAPAAYDFDQSSGFSFELVSNTSQGTLSSCVSGNSFDPSANCVYEPFDGNDNSGDPTPDERYAEIVDYMGMDLEAQFRGAQGDLMGISFRHVIDLDPGEEVVIPRYNGGEGLLEFIIYVGAGTNEGHIIDAINNTEYVQDMIAASPTTGGSSFNPDPTSWGGIEAFSGGVDGLDYFEYKVSNSQGMESFIGRVSIYVTDTPNEPLVCQYSSFADAPECGLTGCRGSGSPQSIDLTPLSDDVVYFDHDNNVCYRSDLSQSSVWGIIDSNIFPIETNERNEIRVEHIILEAGTDLNELTLTDVGSSNTSMIPNEKISMTYNGSAMPIGSSFSLVGDGETLEEMTIVLEPSSGEDGVGETEISFTLTNDAGDVVDTVFTVKINDVSAGHNGWTNIRSVGPKVSDRPGGNLRVHAPEVCNFSRMHCRINGDIDDCRGGSSPHNQVEALDSNVVYYNSSTQICYRSTGPGNNNWVEFSSYCNISPSAYDKELCPDGASCMGASNPSLPADLTTNKNDLYYYNYSSNRCFRAAFDTNANEFTWEQYLGTGETSLSWENFSILGNGSITGYNVYRKVAAGNEKFDYRFPINKEPIPNTVRTYTDNAQNSYFAPVPSTVYHYEVRPIILGIPTATQDYDSVARVVSPPNNMSFVHRWIVNRATCEYLNRSISREQDDSDPEKPGHYACDYVGPGATADGHYDIGRDLLVDRYEAGCNYSRSPACDTSSGDCVSNTDPNSGGGISPTDTSNETIFYNRANGQCYIYNIGSSNWVPLHLYGALTGVEMDHRSPRVPPLTHFEDLDADNYCSRNNARVNRLVGAGFGQTPISSSLPTRKEQMAYSHWDRNNLTEAEINALQAGLSLNSSSKCNSSGANGLESYYTNTATVVSGNAFTMPGTLDSDIRSVITGSDETRLCQSRFGVQDSVGNVAEWTLDQILCRDDGSNIGLSACHAIGNLAADSAPSSSVTSNYNRFEIGGYTDSGNGIVGPCRDSNGLGGCDQPIGSWIIQDQSFRAGRWIIPLGLPAHAEFPIFFPGDPVDDDLSLIGSTSGITTQQLHGDRITLNMENIFTESSGRGTMTTGGSYLSGQGAGRWSLEFFPETDANGFYLQLGDVAFYHPSAQWDIDIIDSASAGSESASCGGNSMVIEIEDGESTAADIVSAVNAGAGCPNAYLSGSPNLGQSSLSEAVPMNEVDARATGDDIGFRCVTPVNDSLYDF